MMDAVRISETSVYFYETTRHHISEGYNLYTLRLENPTLKSVRFQSLAASLYAQIFY
jgi:hypothetical protein